MEVYRLTSMPLWVRSMYGQWGEFCGDFGGGLANSMGDGRGSNPTEVLGEAESGMADRLTEKAEHWEWSWEMGCSARLCGRSF
jgi:hypothetical protein